jgi:hypothetical protein
MVAEPMLVGAGGKIGRALAAPAATGEDAAVTVVGLAPLDAIAGGGGGSPW